MIKENKNFFISKDKLKQNFIFFNTIIYHTDKLNGTNNQIILSKYTEEEIFQGDYSNIGIYEKINNKYILIDKILRNYEYINGLTRLFNCQKLSDKVKIIIVPDNLELMLDMHIYVDKDFILSQANCNERWHIPKLLHQIIINDYEVNNFEDDYSYVNLELQSFNSYNLKINEYFRKHYEYQKKNIKWMIDYENKIINNKLIVKSFLLPEFKNFLYKLNSINEYIVVGKYCRFYDEPKLKSIDFNIYGGVLADDIGLGKTFSLISLIYEKLDKSKSPTLVICPSRLCKQWFDEINISCKLNVKVISSIDQFTCLSIDKLKSFDIIILSYNFLLSKSYINYCLAYPKKDILLHNFKWERVILDEAHEFINKSANKKVRPREIIKYLKTLSYNYIWLCTGTPFATYEDSWHVISFLCNLKTDLLLDTDNLYKYKHVYKKLIDIIFRKNYVDDVEQEISIPKPIISVDLLEMSEIEKNIYNSAFDNKKKQIEFCNHIMVSEEHINILGNKPLPLAEIHKKMTSHYKKNITKLENKLNNLLKEENKDEIYYDRKSELEESIKLNTSKFNIFNSLNEKLKETESCPICFEELENITKTVTPCGHFVCGTCVKKIFKANHEKLNCPICRQEFESEELEIIQSDNSDDVNKLGTKLAKLINYLNEKLSENNFNRIIVFSQWDTMLKMISKILKEKSLNHVFLNGSFHVVNNRVKKFKSNPEIRIVLLSSDKSVSGLNLIEANNIVLLDTMNHEDSNVVKLIEEQAIGRAVRIGQNNQVSVKRFIMRDTIEHEYYLKNKY